MVICIVGIAMLLLAGDLAVGQTFDGRLYICIVYDVLGKRKNVCKIKLDSKND